jgi:hypothetical protein
MIKKTIEKKKSLTASGKVKEVSERGIILEEKKKNETNEDLLTLKDFEPFVDNYVKINIVKSIEGTIESIDDNGINIFDDKNEEHITISLDDFKAFLNSKIRFGIAESEKSEVDEF